MTISQFTQDRLADYLDLAYKLNAANISIVTSKVMGEMLGITSATIRKDFSTFVNMGKQNTGYSTRTMIEVLESMLDIRNYQDRRMMQLGLLGRQLAHYASLKDTANVARIMGIIANWQ